MQDKLSRASTAAEVKDPTGLPRDRILVTGLELPARIGAFAAERGPTQRISISIEAEVAAAGGPERDELSLVPSYVDLIDHAKAVVGEGHIDLVETLAERVAARCLAEPRLALVKVRVEKLERGPKAVGVEIVRVRPRG